MMYGTYVLDRIKQEPLEAVSGCSLGPVEHGRKLQTRWCQGWQFLYGLASLLSGL